MDIIDYGDAEVAYFRYLHSRYLLTDNKPESL